MTEWTIRTRIFFLVMVPLLVSVVFMTAIYTVARINDIEDALQVRGNAIVHQMGPASEYSLYANNVQVMATIVDAVRKEEDVVHAAIFDVQGKVLVESVSSRWAAIKHDAEGYIQFSQDVYLTNLKMATANDVASEYFTGPAAVEGPIKIGTVSVTLSKERAKSDEINTIVMMLSLASVLLAISLWVGKRIAAGITRPIERIRASVALIAHGKLEQRISPNSGGELGELEDGINAMAESLQEVAREDQRRYRALFDYSGDCVFLVRKGTIVDCNRRACQLLEVEESKLIGRRLISSLGIKGQNAEFLRLVDGVLVEEHPRTDSQLFEIEMETGSGHHYDAEANVAQIVVDGDEHLLVFMRDITERKRFQKKLEFQANYDAVTGLPNRLLAQDRLSQALHNAHRHKEGVALMFLDIDRFKNVNDTMGHIVGDRLLDAIGKRLKCLVRESDTVARLGGDEFLVVLAEIMDRAYVEVVAKKIIEKMAEPFSIEGRDLYLGASIGISMYPADGEDYHALLRNADTAMYQAKNEGRNTFRFYTKEIGHKANYYLELEGHLRQSLKRNELELHYQPQVNLESGEVTGAEALLRWHSSHFGQVPLDRFIPVAEETGLIVEIGNWVLECVCRAIQGWREQKLPVIPISVNISSRQLQEPEFVSQVEAILSHYDIGPGLIDFEITESLLLETASMPLNVFRDIKSLGIRISLDDFGVGYSSLSYLKRFPFDILKIDKSFVQDIDHAADDAALIGAFIAIGNALSLEVIAEGVENEIQASFLKRHGATMAQGYFFGRPLPQWQFENYLKKRMTKHSR